MLWIASLRQSVGSVGSPARLLVNCVTVRRIRHFGGRYRRLAPLSLTTYGSTWFAVRPGAAAGKIAVDGNLTKRNLRSLGIS